MVDETTMDPEAQAEWTETVANEDAIISQVVELISSLSVEGQRALMDFLAQEFSTVLDEEEWAKAASPEEQDRKAAAMWEMF